MRIPNIRRRPLVSQQGLDLGLLCSQSYLLGIAIISLSISSYSLFIDSLGAQYIPYVDIAIALATSLVSYGFIRSQMRWGFATVAPHTIAIIACLLLILRFALQLPAMTWVTFALLVLDALLMTFMMILIDTQTGFLFTVREVKQYYPYVMGSFHAGAVTAGLAVPILVQWFGNVENILYVSVGAFALVCFFLYLTAKRYHTDTPPTLSMEPLPQLRQLIQLFSTRYVCLILALQVTAAIGNALVIYLYLIPTEAVYPNAEELSGFFATLAVVRDIGVVIFAGLIAGRLLRRFGIVWGFTLNAMAVGALSLIILLFGWINSFAPQQFFGLTVAAYLLELMFLNGLLSTATRTAYQVLAPNERTKIIAAIDGIGVPMAYGLAALLAITLKQVVGFSIHSIVLLLITVIGMQLVVGLWLRYAYAKRLRHVIQHRSTFDPYLDSSTGMRTATEMVAAMSGNREQIPPTALQDWTVSTQSQKEDCDGTVAQIINQFYQLLQQFGSASVYSTNVQEQLRQLHQQLFSLLGTVYGKELMDNAAQDLLYGNRQQQSLVLEMLEMTFSKEHRRTLLPLLDPHITNASRIMHLQKTTRS